MDQSNLGQGVVVHSSPVVTGNLQVVVADPLVAAGTPQVEVYNPQVVRGSETGTGTLPRYTEVEESAGPASDNQCLVAEQGELALSLLYLLYQRNSMYPDSNNNTSPLPLPPPTQTLLLSVCTCSTALENSPDLSFYRTLYPSKSRGHIPRQDRTTLFLSRNWSRPHIGH